MILLLFEFYDTRGNQYSVQMVDDTYWLCNRHPDGQYVTNRKLTYDEVVDYWDGIPTNEPTSLGRGYPQFE